MERLAFDLSKTLTAYLYRSVGRDITPNVLYSAWKPIFHGTNENIRGIDEPIDTSIRDNIKKNGKYKR